MLKKAILIVTAATFAPTGSFADPKAPDVPNSPFLYLFDFGDQWHFYVRLVEIKKECPKLSGPKVIESKGEAPDQYPSVEDWE